MPRQKTTVYRPTPTNPNMPAADQPGTTTATEDLDDFLDEVDDILQQEEAFAVQYRQKGGQ